MVEQIDKEVEAIKVVLTALEPLTPQLRSSVVEYVMKRLGVTVMGQGQPGAPLQPPLEPDIRIRGSGSADLGATPVHIKVFKETKKPRSANEMAALVAYYLSDLAPPGSRKNTINTKDIETYFKIAEFPRPEHVKVTLQNAKTPGTSMRSEKENTSSTPLDITWLFIVCRVAQLPALQPRRSVPRRIVL